MDNIEIKHFVEAALLAAGRPLSIDQLQGLFATVPAPEKPAIRQALDALHNDYAGRGIMVAEVASGFRIQIHPDMVERLQKLWEERPPRYSRALFETLALVAYRQPITRGEIEEIRGVSVSSNIVRSMLERDWIRVVGHRDVPGRPAMFGTTKGFLDYFGLKKLDDLPPLADLSDWESLRVQLNLPDVETDDFDSDPDADTNLPRLHAAVFEDDEDDEIEIVDATPADDVKTGSHAGEADDIEPAFTELRVTAWPDPLAADDDLPLDDELETGQGPDASVSRG
jgi:segregation and condensation protein B